MRPKHEHQEVISFKECNRCFRDLPLGAYGLSRNSKDGFNHTCKECRNSLKRFCYAQSPDTTSNRDHNQINLKKAMERNQKEIFGYGIKDEIRYKLLIKCGLINHLEIFKEESFLAGYEIMSCEAEFIQQVINQLQNFRIRLIPN